MKAFIKYVILFFATFCIGVSYTYAQDNAEADKTSAKEQKKLSQEEIDHLLQQKKIDEGAVKSAKNIRRLLKDFVDEVAEKSPVMADFLTTKIFGIRVVQYLVSILILLFNILLVKYVFKYIINKLVRLFNRNDKSVLLKMLIERMSKPVNVFAWVLSIYLIIVFLVQDEANIVVLSRAVGIVFWISLFWLISISVDVAFMGISRKFKKNNSTSTANLFDFLRKVVKFVITIIAILSILTNCGVNVNTIIASLGIGGMALAFASQDTIANFFGSVSIILDRPFIVGDWVKTNSCEGTVEVIGFRSTRIRTFSKTLVTIPNSILAKEAVENFTKMPERKVVQVIGLTYATTSKQIEKFLDDLRNTIPQIEGVVSEGFLVEFSDFGPSSLDIKVIYYTKQISFDYFSATKRRVNLAIMDIVAESGLSFAFPSMSLYVEADATKK